MPARRSLDCEGPDGDAALAAAIIDELGWLGCAVDRPRRLSLELVSAGAWMISTLASAATGRSLSATALLVGRSPRPWAAGIFAAVDAPQWPWLLGSEPASSLGPAIPWERWCLSADRFAAWAFGVGLPIVSSRARLMRERFGIGPADPRWIAPSVRRRTGSRTHDTLLTLARTRAERAEALA